jgi:hypothetical protein
MAKKRKRRPSKQTKAKKKKSRKAKSRKLAKKKSRARKAAPRAPQAADRLVVVEAVLPNKPPKIPPFD